MARLRSNSLAAVAVAAVAIASLTLVGCKGESPKPRPLGSYVRTLHKEYIGIGSGAKSYVMTETLTISRPDTEE